MASDEQPTVLIVEDEERVAEGYKQFLETRYDARVATSGGEALVNLDSTVDVVLLDRRMPGMSGDEVLEHIIDLGFSCRVIMVTAVDPGLDIVNMEFDDYLSKPIDKENLFATIDQMLALDRYESLLSEYNSVVKTYATLKSQLSKHEFENSDEFAELEARRAELRDKIDQTINEFTDEEMAEVLRQAHHTG